jgi:hypothetical protein
MLPQNLKPEYFKDYPHQGRDAAIAHLAILRQLPLALAALLLKEMIAFDWKFPAERDEVARQFQFLGGLSPEDLNRDLEAFAKLRLSTELVNADWVMKPQRFSEQLAAYLWSTHQIDDFHAAAERYTHAYKQAVPERLAPAKRLALVVISRQIQRGDYPLFRKLRGHGVYFTHVDPHSDYGALVHIVTQRASQHELPYAHWRIEGATSAVAPGLSSISYVSYTALASARSSLMRKMRKESAAGAGPEEMRAQLVETTPSELEIPGVDPVLARFQVDLLADGSGTQIYSTSFVQWAAREALRRAQPVTLLAYFGPRQSEESANEQLAGSRETETLDLRDSLLDADMGAYYTWLNLQRLSGAEQSSFLVWFEGHGDACGIGPALSPNTECHDALSLDAVLQRLTGTA